MPEIEYRAKTTWPELNELATKIEESPTKYIVEIGTKHGGTVGLLAERSPEKTFITVDIDNQSGEDCEDIENIIRIIGDSKKIGKTITPILKGKVGLIFMDGLQIYDQMEKDIKSWKAMLSEDGYLAIHDAEKCNGTKTIAPAIDGTKQIRQLDGPKRIVDTLLKNGWEKIDTAHSIAFLQERQQKADKWENNS